MSTYWWIKAATLCGVVALAVGGAIAPGASAATGDTVEVSADGLTYGPTLPGGIFAATQLIPGASVDATLWVRNPTSTQTYLRLVLTDVVANDEHFRGALSLRMILAGETIDSPMAAPNECIVLAMAVPLAAGEAMPVALALRLGNLEGTRGQNASADFTLGVTLSEVASASDECGTPTVGIPAIPPSQTRGGTSTTPAAAGSPDATSGSARGSHSPFRGLLIDFNTGRLDDRFLILLVGTTLGLGAGWLTSVLHLKRTQRTTRRTTTRRTTTRPIITPGGTR